MLRRAPRLLPLALLAAAACQTAAPPTKLSRVPNPLEPPLPGRELSEAERETALHVVGAAERGDFVASRRFRTGLQGEHPVTVLVVLESDYLAGSDVLEAAVKLTEEQPDYAAAWEFVGQLQEAAGNLVGALRAARGLAGARPGAAADGRVAEAESRLVASTLERGEASLAAGAPGEALDTVREALDNIPGTVALRKLAVRAALAASKPRAAAELVASLPDDDDSNILKARVASALGQWGLAIEFYRRVPEGYPGRCAEFREARERWRLSNAPPYVGEALDAKEVRRRDLAALLVWEMPGLAGLQDAPVIVFEDVVQLPEQRDIVTVARAGVMLGDTVTRRFDPERKVSAPELRTILGRLVARVGRPAPKWCVDDATPGCLRLPDVLEGRFVARLTRSLVIDPEELCR